jgi:hypothetical protein
MLARHLKRLPAPFLILGLVMVLGCAKGGGPRPGPDAETDGWDDVVDDVPADSPGDGEDVEGDADDDGGEAGPVHSFVVETSGGARLNSSSYQLEVFVGPVRPVGSATSSSYMIDVGPGAVRSP